MLYAYINVNEFYFVLYDVSYVNACLFRNGINIPSDDDYFDSRKIMGIILLLFNPLSPELNPICYLLALLGAHHFLHVSRIRVRLLTLR